MTDRPQTEVAWTPTDARASYDALLGLLFGPAMSQVEAMESKGP